jgi:gliding motility-associated-like protein
MTNTTCSGVAFTSTPVNVTNGVVPTGTTYSWSAPFVTGGITGGAAGTNQTSISGTLTNPTNTPQTATYTITPTANGCVGATFALTVTVNPAPAITAMTAAVCTGNPFTVTPVNVTNGVVPTGTTYSWSAPSVTGGITGGAAGTNQTSISGTLTNPTNLPQTATYTVTPTSGTCTGPNFTVTVTVNPAPSINPMTAAACTDSAFTVSPVNVTNGVVPTGTTYSWSAPSVTGGITGGAAGTNQTSISGTLTNPTSEAQTATYTVTPTSGACPGADFTVTVTVNPLPAITPMTNTTCSGVAFASTPVNVTNGVVPTGTTYSWSAPSVTGGITGGAAGTNQTSISGTLTNPTNTPQTATYTITPTANGCVGATFTLTVTVNPAPAITAMTAAVCTGNPFTVTPVNVTNGVVPTGTTYSWSAPSVTGGITGGAAGTNQTSISGTLTNPTNLPQTATYTVTPTSGTCPGPTFTVTVTVNPLPAINPMTAAACTGSAFTVTPVNVTNGVVPTGTTYSWSAPSVTGGITGGAAGTNQTSISGTLTNPTNTPQTATYNITPTANGCVGATFTVTVTVYPAPAITTMTAAVCTGNPFTVTPVNVTNGVVPTGTTYSWSAPSVTGGITGGAAGTNQTSISGTLTNPTNLPQTATYTVTPTSGTCTGPNFTVTVTVNPAPAINPMTAVACTGSAFTVTPVDVTNGVVPTGTTYSWSTPVVTGGMTGGAAGTNQTNISGTLVNPTNTAQTATYTVTPTTGSCTGANFSVTVTVNPTPAINPMTTSICPGGTFAVSPLNITNGVVPSGTTYTWSAPVVTGGITGGAGGTNQTSISGTLTNPTTSPQTATYTVTPTAGSCTGATFTVTVTVNPTPVITLTPSNPTECNFVDGFITVNGSGTGNITWSGAATGSILGAPLPQTITGLGAGNYNVRFTDITTGCSSATVTAVLNNPGAPIINSISDFTSCGINYVLTMDSISGSNLTSGVGFFASPNGADPIDLATNSVITAAMSPMIVYVFDNNGTCDAEISFVVTVNTNPTASITPDPAVACQGVAIPLNGNPSGGSGVYTSHAWTGDIGILSSTILPNPTVSASTVSGVYNLTYTVTDNNNCIATDNIEVTINPNPEISGILSVCVGLTTTLSATNTPNATSPWVSSNPAIATVDNFGVVTGVAAGSAQITYTDVNGCTDMETVVVNANPVISLTAADPSVCNGTDGSILVDGTGSGSLTWSGTASGSNGSVSLPFTITNLAAGTYNVTFTNTTTGCVSNNPSTTLSDPNSPILNPIGNVIACEGEFVVPAYTEISGSNMTGSQAFYSASGGNGLLAPGTVITAAMSPMTIYAYDIDGDCFSEVSFTVTINALPTVASIIGSGQYCEGDLVSDVLVTVTGSADWTLNYTLDGVAQTSTGSVSPLNLGNAAGVYTLTSISDANCTNTATGSATIVVFPRPDAPSVSDAVTYCSTVVFDAMTATGGSGTMTWYTDEDLTSVYGTGNSIAPANVLGATTYYVTETANGCEGPSSSIVITVEGCDIIVSTAITPNGDGNNDRWVIPNLDDAYPDAIVRIYNRWGSLLFEHNSATMGKYNDNAWDGSFNGTALPVGSYFFIIEFNDANKEKLNGAVSIILQ